jgi:hypothetical protein
LHEVIDGNALSFHRGNFRFALRAHLRAGRLQSQTIACATQPPGAGR